MMAPGERLSPGKFFCIEIYRLADTPLLMALPLFTFAGYLMGQSQTSRRLVRLTRILIGWMPGGLAIVARLVNGPVAVGIII